MEFDGDNEQTEVVFTNQERQKKFDDMKLSIDWNVVKDLFHKFDERLAARKGREPLFRETA